MNAFVVQDHVVCPGAQLMPRHRSGEQRHSRHYCHSTSRNSLGWSAATANSNLGSSVRRIACLNYVTPELLQAEMLWGKQAGSDQAKQRTSDMTGEPQSPPPWGLHAPVKICGFL